MYDAGFKMMFSHGLMAEMLVRRHVREWAGIANYSAFAKWPTELVADNLSKRYPDLVWRALTQDGKADLLLLLEFQERPDPDMAIRVNAYRALARQELRRQTRADGLGARRCSVRSLVLYHGKGAWTAPVCLDDLVGSSRGDQQYRVVLPRNRDAPPPTPRDLPEMVLRLARNWDPMEMRRELRELNRVVEDCRNEHFSAHVGKTVRAMLLSRGYPGELLKEAENMETVMSAFERGLIELREKGRAEGREKGRAEGREKGRAEGRVQILRQIAARKFGAETARQLSSLLVGPADERAIDRITQAIVECDSGAAFLARAGRHA